jgi:hypothetical protein
MSVELKMYATEDGEKRVFVDMANTPELRLKQLATNGYKPIDDIGKEGLDKLKGFAGQKGQQSAGAIQAALWERAQPPAAE